MANELFKEFNAVSKQEWLAKIEKDLRGKSIDTLSHEYEDGFAISPIVSKEDFSESEFNLASKNPNWIITQEFDAANPQEANDLAMENLEGGLEGITLSNVDSTEALDKATKGFLKDAISLYVSTDKLQHGIDLFDSYSNQDTLIKGGINIDPIGSILKNGSSKELELQLKQVTENWNSTNYKLINIDTRLFANAGATITQQIAIALSIGNEYLNNLSEIDIDSKEFNSKVRFSFATGTNFYSEVGKLKVFRKLWKSVCEEYGINTEVEIHCSTSSYFQSTMDEHNNLLRATSQGFASIVGGCNSLEVIPFTDSYKKATNQAYRLSKNLQLLLKEESYLNKVADASAGSYYMEILMQQQETKAWELFLEIENNGGFIETCKQDMIQNWIEEAHSKRVEKIRSGELIMIGVNKHPGQFPKENSKPTPIQEGSEFKAINPSRLVAEYELETLKNK